MLVLQSFFILVTFFALIKGQCTVYNYNTVNVSCSTNNNDPQKCMQNLDCSNINNNNYCNFPLEAQPCGNGLPGCPSLFSDCINGKCNKRRYPGDVCYDDGECTSDTCTGGFCQGLSEGMYCRSGGGYADCAPGLFCTSDNVCQKAIKVDEPCEKPNGDNLHANNENEKIMCVAGSYCDHTRNRCTKYLSQPEGAIIGTGNNDGCQRGFITNNGACAKLSTNSNKGRSCRNNGECNNGAGVCSCPQPTQNGVCTDPLGDIDNSLCDPTEYFNCLEKNRCPNTLQYVSGSCVQRFCSCEYVALRNCKTNAYPDVPAYPLTQRLAYDCSSASSFAIHLVAIAIAMAMFI